VALETCHEKWSAQKFSQQFLCHLQNQANSHFSLAIRSSLSLFLGNIPLTARLRISPPPHFSIMRSIVISFKLPGRVVCE
jgi:hypothetical protein